MENITDEELRDHIKAFKTQSEQIQELFNAGRTITDAVHNFGFKERFAQSQHGIWKNQGGVSRSPLPSRERGSDIARDTVNEILSKTGTTDKKFLAAGEAAVYRKKIEELEDEKRQLEFALGTRDGAYPLLPGTQVPPLPNNGGYRGSTNPTHNVAYIREIVDAVERMQERADIMDLMREIMPQRKGRGYSDEDSPAIKKIERKFEKFEKIFSERETEDRLIKLVDPLKNELKGLRDNITDPKDRKAFDRDLQPVLKELEEIKRTSETNAIAEKFANIFKTEVQPIKDEVERLKSGTNQPNPLDVVTHMGNMQVQNLQTLQSLMPRTSPPDADKDPNVATTKIAADLIKELKKIESGEKPSTADQLMKVLLTGVENMDKIVPALQGFGQKNVQQQHQKIEFPKQSIELINELHANGDNTFEGLTFDTSNRPRLDGKLIPREDALEIYNRGAEKYAQQQPEPTVESKGKSDEQG